MIVPMACHDGSLSSERLVYVSHLGRCEMQNTKNRDRWTFPDVSHLFFNNKIYTTERGKSRTRKWANRITKRSAQTTAVFARPKHCAYVLYVPLPFHSISKWIQGYNLLKLMAVKRRNLKEKELPPSYWITEQTDYLYSRSP